MGGEGGGGGGRKGGRRGVIGGESYREQRIAHSIMRKCPRCAMCALGDSPCSVSRRARDGQVHEGRERRCPHRSVPHSYSACASHSHCCAFSLPLLSKWYFVTLEDCPGWLAHRHAWPRSPLFRFRPPAQCTRTGCITASSKAPSRILRSTLSGERATPAAEGALPAWLCYGTGPLVPLGLLYCVTDVVHDCACLLCLTTLYGCPVVGVLLPPPYPN